MSKTLIVAEIQNGALREATLELVALARKVGGELVSLVIGSGLSGQAETLAKQGGGKVLLADAPTLADYTSDGWADAIQRAVAAEAPDLILISNTPSGWDVAPKVAAALDAGIITDVFNIENDGGELAFTRRLFNGRYYGRYRIAGSPRIATVQPGAIAAYEGSDDGSVEPLEVDSAASRSEFVEIRSAEAGGHDLSKAEIIVSGGRGLAKPENFEEVLKPLVDALGAQMGASRPVVDAGWLPHEYQVGSSGQVVQPKLYVAVGISGAIQHLVGMKSSNFILAINKDPDAPIFEIADLGVVQDLFEFVPKFAAAVESAKGG
ncbi:MAG: electron transfer flavoprotein subunit alpha/FixB family protein [Myxococcota bacterium]|nr:electron transfer flavoprotein subunit alpha/FixB family protein [Myxococcota bacterium]